ncbi:DNA-3-methyladenine glycosylase 2 family protein [Diaminobutyricimonas sp. TR449]|uniref:DNA-3-methyladenine glycosylase family protein n=1 Tax=Diaminobutyricimonas sp. TR449 TaxID=2708076 RepID=UPI00141EE4AD|nr:DNA-3-methyladenine glycosylase 2 family protein [Diaminobutyricimonas sp. TR449]
MPLESTYAPRESVDLRATLAPVGRGTYDPTFRWEGQNVWLTLRTANGPATLFLRAGREIAATAWGPGAERALDSVPALCGAGDDWSALDVADNPLLAETWRRMPGLRLPRTGRVFAALVPAILEQKVTAVEALRAWRQLVTRHGEEPPGPAPLGMRVIPTAAGFKRIPSWEWHKAGVGPQRSATVMRAAAVAASIDRLADKEDAGTRLRSIPGIGIWTAAEVTQRTHADPDAVSVGDYHLAAFVGWAMVGAPVDDDGMLELLEPWRGQRQRVVRLLLASGIRKPSFGPRMTIQDHRRY